MSVIKLTTFGGQMPAVDDRLLPNASAAYSRDAYLYTGTLIGWREPKNLHHLTASTNRYAFRVPADNAKTAITDTSYWLEFDDVDTKVVRTPVIEDAFERYYFASPSVVPKYNTKDRIAAGLHPWILGVPAPTSAPGVSPSGGTGLGLQTSRAYVYTWVTSYGEEGAPSPPLVANGFLDDTWTVTLTAPAGADMGTDRPIATTRIYRTVTSDTGVATYFLVEEIDATTTTYYDSFPDDLIAENIELASTTWGAPPSDLKTIIQAANGMVVGFKKNEVHFSVPFRPHAWDSNNTLTTEYPIVGLGVIGQSIVVCTTGYPVILTGPAPDTITSNIIRKAEPCTSARSIVSAPDAVYYTSPNGLIAVTSYGSITNTTEAWITREKWRSLVPLVSGSAIMSGPAYFSFGTIHVVDGIDIGTEAQTGFTINSPQTASQEVSGPGGAHNPSIPAFGQLTAPSGNDIYNVMLDYWTSVPLIIQNQEVLYYDYADAAPTIKPYKWKSKVFQMNAKHNYSAMRCWYRVPTGTTTQNSTRTVTATIPTLAADMHGIVRIYVNGGSEADADATTMTLHTTRELRKSGELLRILSGSKYEFWQIELEGRVEIIDFQMATSVKELGDV